MEQAAVSQLDHRQALGMWSAATVATSLKPWIPSRQPSKLRAIENSNRVSHFRTADTWSKQPFPNLIIVKPLACGVPQPWPRR